MNNFFNMLISARLSIILFFIFCTNPFVHATSIDKYGGQIVLSTSSDPKSFNAILAKETSTTLVTNMIFEGLTTTNAVTAQVEPHLAETWEVSPDGLIWTFHLRRNVKWHDGVPFTADDVTFTFNDLVYNPDIPSSARDIFTIDGQPFKVEKMGDFTVQFTLPTKFAPFLRGLSQEILPKHKLKHVVDEGKFNPMWGIDTDPKEIVGTGPFKLTKYLPAQRLIFTRNPNYWKKSDDGNPLPYLDKIIYLIVQNADVQLLKFMEGALDYYGMRGMDYPYLKPLETKRNFTIHDLGPATGSNFITFNLNSSKNPENNKPYVDPVKLLWFSNRNFRRAVAHAIDKEKIIEIVLNGLGYPQHSPIGPGAGFFHNPDVPQYNYDLEKARKILSREGFKDRDKDGILEDKDGNHIEFNLYTNSGSTERVDIAGIIRQDLEQLGMKVNFMALEFNSLVSKLTSTFEWHAIVLGLTGGIEPHFGKNVWDSSGGLHLWHPQQKIPSTPWEKRINELFLKGVQELDEARRKVYYDDFQIIVAKNLPVIYTSLNAKISALRNKFGNINPTNYGGVLHNLEEIFVWRKYLIE